MRASFGSLTSLYLRPLLLGAVLMGCAFAFPAMAGAAGLAVQILKPDCDPIVFDAGQEHEFEAVAFAQGAELEGGQVTWNWDFGDDTPDSAANPTTHTFAARGNFHVVVTATYGTLSGQAELNVQAASPGTEELREKTTLTAHCGGPSGPAFGGGQVCDETALAVRIPLSAVNGHLDEVRFERLTTAGWVSFAVFGSAQLDTETVGNQVSYLCWTDWPTCADKNDVTVSFRARITVGHYDPNNGYVESWYTAAQGWAPKNTVVKAALADPLKHMKGDAKHTLSWDITHLACDPAPTFNAHVQVFDLGGGEIASATVPCGIGTGSWDWVPTCGPMGEDANGLYTYKVTADHGMCGDCDKAGAPTWQVDGFTAALDVPTMTATFTLQYHATGGDVTEAEAVIYNPDLDELARLTLGTGGEVPANALLTAQAQVQLPPGGPWGAFRVALLGNQTFDAGLNNRDRIAKPLVVKGGVCSLLPTAHFIAGGGAYDNLSQYGVDAAKSELERYPQLTGEAPYAIVQDVYSNQGFVNAFRDAALFQYVGHGSPYFAGHTYVGEYSLDELLTAKCPRLLLGVWYNCNSAATTYGIDTHTGEPLPCKDWPDEVVKEGKADCAIGWEGEPWLHMAAPWSGVFWSNLALTMDADYSCYDAAWYAWQVAPCPYGILTYKVRGNMTLPHTRWGEAP